MKFDYCITCQKDKHSADLFGSNYLAHNYDKINIFNIGVTKKLMASIQMLECA